MTKKERGKGGGKVVEEAEESKHDATSPMKIFKEAQKNGVLFAQNGKMLTTLYIYNIIYNII